MVKKKSRKKMPLGFKLMWAVLFVGIASGVGWGAWQLTPGKRMQRLVDHAREMIAEKSWGESIVALRKALKIYPDNKGLHYMLMQSLFADGKARQGLAEMENMLLMPPFDGDIYRSHFDEYYGMVRIAGNPEEMHAQAEKMRGILPENDYWMTDLLDAQAYFIKGERDKAVVLFRQIVESGIDHYLLKLDMAQALLAVGKFTEAEVVYTGLLKRDPNALDPLNGLAMSLAFQGRRDEALDAYIRASLSSEPPVLGVLLNGAMFSMNQNRIKEAKKYFIDRLTKYYPDNTKGLLIRIRYAVLAKDEAHFFRMLGVKLLQIKKNQFIELTNWCLNHGQPRWALQMLQDYTPPDMETDVVIEYRILAMIHLQQMDEAKKLVSEITDQQRRDFLLAEIDFQSGKLQAAEKAFAKLVATGEESSTGVSRAARQRMMIINALQKKLDNAELLPRARILLAQGKAETVLELLSGAKKSDADIGLLGVMALMQLDRKEKAVAALEVLRKQYPDREDVWLIWGRSVSETNPEKALDGLQKAIASKADGPSLRSLLGEVQYKLGQHDAAIRTWRTVSKRWPNTLSGNIANVFRAQAYMAKKDWSSATTIWELVLKIAPDDPLTLNNLAYCLLKSGRELTRAKAMAEHALLIQPGNAAISDTLNEIRKLMQHGKTKAAG